MSDSDFNKINENQLNNEVEDLLRFPVAEPKSAEAAVECLRVIGDKFCLTTRLVVYGGRVPERKYSIHLGAEALLNLSRSGSFHVLDDNKHFIKEARIQCHAIMDMLDNKQLDIEQKRRKEIEIELELKYRY